MGSFHNPAFWEDHTMTDDEWALLKESVVDAREGIGWVQEYDSPDGQRRNKERLRTAEHFIRLAKIERDRLRSQVAAMREIVEAIAGSAVMTLAPTYDDMENLLSNPNVDLAKIQAQARALTEEPKE